MSNFYEWLKEVRCTTVREAAKKFAVFYTSMRKRLKRLVRRGVLEEKKVGRVAVYCLKDGAELPPPPPRKRIRTKIVQRAEQAAELLAAEGCVATSALMQKLGLSHTQALYVLRLLQGEGRAVEVLIGKTAIWCRDRRAAEDLIRRLRDAVHRLAVSNGLRYVTPSKILHIARRDKAYELFTKFVNLSRFDGDYIPPVTLAFIDSILASLYGGPIRHAPHKHVYFVTPHPRQDLGDIAIKDGASRAVTVSLPPDLAAALADAERCGTSAEEIVKQAIDQLLARYR